jgi:hypothetical protein
MSDDGSVECPMAKRMKLIENYNPIKNDINVPATGGGLNKDEKLGESLRNFHVLDEVNENDSDEEQEGESLPFASKSLSLTLPCKLLYRIR